MIDTRHRADEDTLIDTKRAQLDSAITKLQQRWGSSAVLQARTVQSRPAAIPTGFSQLDNILGVGGIPVNSITLLRGKITSGKRTLAYMILRHAQYSSPDRLQSVSILDLARSTDYDFAARCGIHLDHLFISTPESARKGIDALLDMVRSRQLRAILLDHITLIQEEQADWRYFTENLSQLNVLLRNSNCALIFLDEAGNDHARAAIGAQIALHLELDRERWIEDTDEFRGYQSRARVLRTKRGRVGASVTIEFDFKNIIRGQEIW